MGIRADLPCISGLPVISKSTRNSLPVLFPSQEFVNFVAIHTEHQSLAGNRHFFTEFVILSDADILQKRSETVRMDFTTGFAIQFSFTLKLFKERPNDSRFFEQQRLLPNSTVVIQR
jgi:hypothetical protein